MGPHIKSDPEIVSSRENLKQLRSKATRLYKDPHELPVAARTGTIVAAFKACNEQHYISVNQKYLRWRKPVKLKIYKLQTEMA